MNDMDWDAHIIQTSRRTGGRWNGNDHSRQILMSLWARRGTNMNDDSPYVQYDSSVARHFE